IEDRGPRAGWELETASCHCPTFPRRRGTSGTLPAGLDGGAARRDDQGHVPMLVRASNGSRTWTPPGPGRGAGAVRHGCVATGSGGWGDAGPAVLVSAYTRRAGTLGSVLWQ